MMGIAVQLGNVELLVKRGPLAPGALTARLGPMAKTARKDQRVPRVGTVNMGRTRRRLLVIFL